MKVHEMEQGTHEWEQARLGIPTASQFNRIMTSKTMNPSSAQAKYRAELLAEWLLGQPLDAASTAFMERGQTEEAEARRYYEFERDVEVQRVGFLSRDDGKVGGSPDGLVGLAGGLEIKVLEAKNHVLAMLGEFDDYRHQVQGYLYLTGREWWDVLFYNGSLPSVIHRFERHEEYIEALSEELDAFVGQLDADKERLREYKLVRPWHDEIQKELQQSEADAAVRRMAG